MMSQGRRAWLIAAAVLTASVAAAEPAPTPNANISRWASGVIAYRVASTGAINGYESWRLTVHPSGERTMSARVEYAPRSIQRHVIHRTSRDWRPLETYAVTWVEGVFRGSASVVADDPVLRITGLAPGGAVSHDLDLRGPVAIVPHVISVDSWRATQYDKTKGGEQPIYSYNMNATGDGDQGILGRLMDYRLTWIGNERVTVPAGTFETDHFRIEDAVDIYLNGPDAMAVKFVYRAIDREHLLIEHSHGSGP